ncbi:hypothetical protein [Variovorax sp. YR216]|uniref:hypothetical protein n=1 Tax=Variovorax sp. YR216 TaxID=1882828 RepID=UPI000B8178BA|nr:hypothetical protein [Variovorax sp. YR216]
MAGSGGCRRLAKPTILAEMQLLHVASFLHPARVLPRVEQAPESSGAVRFFVDNLDRCRIEERSEVPPHGLWSRAVAPKGERDEVDLVCPVLVHVDDERIELSGAALKHIHITAAKARFFKELLIQGNDVSFDAEQAAVKGFDRGSGQGRRRCRSRTI